MTTKKARDTKASGTRVPAPGKDLAELATVSRDVAEREQAGRHELEKRCRHLGKLVEESAATIGVLRGQLKQESNERKRAELDIRAALEYAENIIATVPRPFLILNADLRVISANRSFYQDFKVAPEETAGHFIYDLGNRQWDIPELRDLLEHILPENTTVEGFEITHDFPSIGRRVMLLNARRVYRIHDEPPLILLVMEDATQRKSKEQLLQATLEYAENIIAAVPVSLLVLDADLRVISANRSFYQTFKVTPEETVGQFIYDLGNRQWDIPRLRDLLEHILPEHTSIEGFEMSHDFQSIGQRVMILNARRISREFNTTPLLVLGIEDITGREKAEKVLKLASAYNRSLIEVSLDPLVTIGPDGKITDVNVATEAVTGYAREQLIGTDFSDYFTDPEKARAGYQQVFRDGKVLDYALDLRHRDGHVTSVLYNASVHRDEKGEVIGIFAAARDITERKRAEEELRKHREHLEVLVEQRTRQLRETEEKAEREYTTIVQTALDGFWVNDLKGRILDVSNSYCQMTGYSREELLTMNIAHLKAYERPDDIARHIDKIMKQGYDRFETRHRRKDGTPIDVDVSVNYIDIGGGRLIEFVRDITERKKAQEELEENTRRLDIAVEASQIGIWELDLISDTSIRNLRHDQIFGYEEVLAEWGAKIFFEHIIPEDRPSVKAAFDEAMKTGRLFFECRISWPDKSIHWITATGKALGDSTGKPIKMLGTVTDISERKEAENKIRLSEIHLRELLGLHRMTASTEKEIFDFTLEAIGRSLQSPFAFIDLMSADGAEMTIYAWSKGAMEQCAVTEKPIHLLVAEAGLWGEAVRQRRPIVVNDYDTSTEFKKGYPKGHVPIKRFLCIPLFSASRIVAVAAVANKVSEYNEADTNTLISLINEMWNLIERKRMVEKLLASERLATLGQLSGNISHELRNPLGVIASSAYYLKSALKGNDHKVEQHLERIKNNVDSAVAIIDSLLNLTRMKPPQLERLDLTAIISDAIASAKLPPTVSLVRDFPEQGLLVDADRVQLPMCFKNIVKNAVEAMEGTGTLTVTVHRTADGQAETSFADTGPGIPTDNLTNIFQPLFSTKAKGIGFGLSIAKMIIDRHGGIIEAKSEPGQGANIIIRLPLEAKQHMEDKHV